MSAGRRAKGYSDRSKINFLKIFVAIILVIAVIVAIVLLVKFVKNKDNKNIENNIEVSTNKEEKTEKTLEEIIEEFGGTLKEKIKPDTAYCTKDDKEYTIYQDGEIVEGRVVMWDGTSQKPAIDEARKY